MNLYSINLGIRWFILFLVKNEEQYEIKTCMRLELSTNEQVKEGD